MFLPFKRSYSFELYYSTENWHLKLYFISSLFSIVNNFVVKWKIRSFLLIFFPFHNFRSSKSRLPSTPVPGFVRTPKPAGKAVTLATVNARVPRMPVCLKKNCGWNAWEFFDDSSDVTVRLKRSIVIFTTNCTWRLRVSILPILTPSFGSFSKQSFPWWPCINHQDLWILWSQTCCIWSF